MRTRDLAIVVTAVIVAMLAGGLLSTWMLNQGAVGPTPATNYLALAAVIGVTILGIVYLLFSFWLELNKC